MFLCSASGVYFCWLFLFGVKGGSGGIYDGTDPVEDSETTAYGAACCLRRMQEVSNLSNLGSFVIFLY